MKRSGRLNRAGLGLLLALLTMSPALDAQTRQGRRGQGQSEGRRDEMQRQLQRRFNAEIRDRLGFDDEQMEALMGVMREHGQLRRELAQRRQRSQMKVRMLGKEDMGGAALSDELATQVLADLVDISQQEADLFRAEQAALLEQFSPMQVFQFQQAREEMAERIRSLRGEKQGRRGRGGPGGADGALPPLGGWFR